MAASSAASPQVYRSWRALGFWLSLVMALLQAVNAVRSFVEPVGFAIYMGLPFADPHDAGLLQLYGLRCGFIAVMVAIFLGRGNLEALKWVALGGAPIPLGDAFLVFQASGPALTIARHIAISLYVVVTFLALHAWVRRQ